MDDDARLRAQKREQGQKVKWTADTLQAAMANPEGRWWVCQLLERCSIFTPVYRHDGDALGMAWRDGAADVGRWLLAQLDEHCPNQYQQMMRERRARIERAKEKAEKDIAADSDEVSVTTPLEDMMDEQARKYDAGPRAFSAEVDAGSASETR